MGDILVGTASWADKSLLDSKLFYPKETKSAESRLRYYADHFPLVELDSSYYALPAPQVAELWAQRTPEHFVFDIKAFRVFTQHQTPHSERRHGRKTSITATSRRSSWTKCGVGSS